MNMHKESIERSHIRTIWWSWQSINQIRVILHLQVFSLVDLVYSWQLCANSIPPCTSYLVCDSSLHPPWVCRQVSKKVLISKSAVFAIDHASLLVMRIEQQDYKAYDWMDGRKVWVSRELANDLDRERTLWCNWHFFFTEKWLET